MACNSDFVQYIIDQCSGAGEIAVKKMMGDYCAYCDGVLFGLICDNNFYVKVTEPGRAVLKEIILRPPYDGAKDYFYISDVVLNESLFGHPSKMAVSVSYGVYPNSDPGYTDWFRQATTLEYTPLTISDSRKSGKVSTGNVPGAAAAPFKVFKQPYNKDLFKVEIGNSYPDDIATRLSSQTMGGDIERRYYGNSLFFCNKNADYSTVDNVQYVADPQIFLPFNEERRVIADPDIPDMVVSVNITFLSKGPLEEEESWKTYTLRYIPKVQLIAAKDVKGIADKIVAKANGGLPSYMNYRTAPAHQDIVKAYSDAISSQLSK